jgi:Flp pilus assembly protein TadD
MRHALALLFAALALPLAIALAIVAVDVFRTPAELTTHDRRFQAAPTSQARLWDVGLLPRDASEKLLGLEDDVDYREVAALYVEVEPGKVDVQSVPKLESMRSEARSALSRLTGEENDPVRRSRLLTMYGVMTLDARRAGNAERKEMLEAAVAAFRRAIDLDPSNTEAMTNLEAVLSRFGPVAVGGS